MGIPSGGELVVLLVVLVLLFGATKLPTAARSLGQSIRIFKAEMKGPHSEEEPTSPVPQQPSPVPQQPSLAPPGPAATGSSYEPTGSHERPPIYARRVDENRVNENRVDEDR
jgi:sec-independent protein translocase protein TatA